MTDNMYYAKCWLDRTRGFQLKIDALDRKRQIVQNGLSGVSKYSAKESTSDHYENATEAAFCEFSMLSDMIEKEQNVLAYEDAKTLEVISKLENQSQQAVLIDRYINRLPWSQIAAHEYYSESHVKELHSAALKEIYQYIPRDEIILTA